MMAGNLRIYCISDFGPPCMLTAANNVCKQADTEKKLEGKLKEVTFFIGYYSDEMRQ